MVSESISSACSLDVTVARRSSCGLIRKSIPLAHPVVGLVLQVGDAEKFPQALGFESLDPFLRVSEQGPCFTAIEEDGDDKRFVKPTTLRLHKFKKKMSKIFASRAKLIF